MTKHHWRDSIKSLFGSHIDPKREEQMRGTKIEIEGKVNKILKLIKDEDLDENDDIRVENFKKELFVEVIEDFHKQYQSLYSLYDHLTGEVRKKVNGKQEKEISSDSDSDYSSKDKGSKSGQLDSKFQKITDNVKEELEAANVEVAELKMKLTARSEEKEALNLEYRTALSKIEEAEKIIQDLNIDEKSKLLVENEELNQKVDISGKTEADLNQRLEDLKRDLQKKGDELSTLIEKVQTNEVKLRLSNQKLRVTEQLLTEKEESFRNTEAKFRQELRMLEERITTLSGIIATNNEAHHMMITDISKKVNSTSTELETVIQKFEEDWGNYENVMSEMSKEIQIPENWVTETNNEREQLKEEVGNLVEQLQGKKEQESLLREKVKKLEVEASKGEYLTKAVNHLEKKVRELEKMMEERDNSILGLGEEKREAIRQLCQWIDYHRDRCDNLKDVLSKMTARSQRTACLEFFDF